MTAAVALVVLAAAALLVLAAMEGWRWAFFAGVLIPWFYLLGSPAQRHLATYERRTARRGR